MLKRLIAVGTLSAKVQRPDYKALVYKGGRVTIALNPNHDGYILSYTSPEGFGHLVKGWKLAEEDVMREYLLKLADETRWKPVQP